VDAVPGGRQAPGEEGDDPPGIRAAPSSNRLNPSGAIRERDCGEIRARGPARKTGGIISSPF